LSARVFGASIGNNERVGAHGHVRNRFARAEKTLPLTQNPRPPNKSGGGRVATSAPGLSRKLECSRSRMQYGVDTQRECDAAHVSNGSGVLNAARVNAARSVERGASIERSARVERSVSVRWNGQASFPLPQASLGERAGEGCSTWVRNGLGNLRESLYTMIRAFLPSAAERSKDAIMSAAANTAPTSRASDAFLGPSMPAWSDRGGAPVGVRAERLLDAGIGD